jgi:hypothetical protein
LRSVSQPNPLRKGFLRGRAGIIDYCLLALGVVGFVSENDMNQTMPKEKEKHVVG